MVFYPSLSERDNHRFQILILSNNILIVLNIRAPDERPSMQTVLLIPSHPRHQHHFNPPAQQWWLFSGCGELVEFPSFSLKWNFLWVCVCAVEDIWRWLEQSNWHVCITTYSAGSKWLVVQCADMVDSSAGRIHNVKQHSMPLIYLRNQFSVQVAVRLLEIETVSVHFNILYASDILPIDQPSNGFVEILVTMN